MPWLHDNPRLMALVMIVVGCAVVAAIIAVNGMEMGGRTGNKAIFFVGIGGIAVGVGLTQLVWPPRRKRPDDDRGVFGRASWPQKILWILGGMVGVVAVAVLQTVATGKY